MTALELRGLCCGGFGSRLLRFDIFHVLIEDTEHGMTALRLRGFGLSI